MSERDSIFARIREALRVPAPAPDSHGESPGRPAGPASAADQRRVLPAVAESFDQRVALFAKNSIELRSDFKRVNDLTELAADLKRLREAEGWSRVATHKGPLTDAACAALGLPVLLTDSGFDQNDLERCPVGITECDVLIAQTGSVVVTSRSAGGRSLSVLPPHHIVLARHDQLVADLPEAFARLKSKYGSAYPSMISFITGPSRTGDIERILVLGAHGPQKLTIFLV